MPFLREKTREAFTSRVPEPHPNEMEDFMNKNQAQLWRLFEQFTFEHDLAATNEAGRVHRSAMPRPR